MHRARRLARLAAVSAALLASARLGAVDLVPADAVWRYLDHGADLGTAWRDPAYEDCCWLSGPAPLGYGRDALATELSFGWDPAAKPATVYFRHRFQVADPAAIDRLSALLARDDGIAVYLNGREAWRDNLSAGADARTLASRSIGSDDTVAVELDPGLLVAGENVLAVEVHQDDPAGPDLAFALALSVPDGSTPPPPPPQPARAIRVSVLQGGAPSVCEVTIDPPDGSATASADGSHLFDRLDRRTPYRIELFGAPTGIALLHPPRTP